MCISHTTSRNCIRSCSIPECAICLDPIVHENDSNIRVHNNKIIGRKGHKFNFITLGCGHQFHKDCIRQLYFSTNHEFHTDPWNCDLFQEHTDACPMCRSEIKAKSGTYHTIVNDLWLNKKIDMLYEALEFHGIEEEDYFAEYSEYSDSEDSELPEEEEEELQYASDEYDECDESENEEDVMRDYSFVGGTLWGELRGTLGYYMSCYDG